MNIPTPPGASCGPHHFADISAGEPLLLVVIDTEEEFDWNAAFNRTSRSVANIQEQYFAQELCESYGVTPTYVIDYPVASTPESAAVFSSWARESRAVVGTHLHPWVNPPEIEDVSARLSYPGNLPLELERAKLQALTEQITKVIGMAPTIYKAGRYGLGPNSPQILTDLGYEIDLSVVPETNFSEDGGPDYRAFPHEPYWFGPDVKLFEVPLTRGYPGLLGGMGRKVYEVANKPLGKTMKLPGILSRLKLVERIQLTPEGVTAVENIRLLRHLRASGRRVYTYAYHSSSLLPGGSPYVRSKKDRDHFLDEMKRFLDFFMGEFGGRGTTPYELRSLATVK